MGWGRTSGALYLALALMAGCGEEPAGTSGSALVGPIVWAAARGPDGETSESWVARGGALAEDTLSVTLTASGDADERLSLGVRDATGRVLVDPRRPEHWPNRVLPFRGVVVGMIPSGSAALPLSSNFAVRALVLGAGAGPSSEGWIQMAAWIKHSGRTAAVPPVQELPLAAFQVGGRSVPDGRLRVALAEAGRIWRRAGIELGEPARVRIDGADGERLERIEIDPALGSDSPALGALLRLSDRGPPGTLALFLVADIVVAGPQISLWALSGSIPVPPLAGTARSGIALDAQLVDADPVWAGQVIAHEIGHALGLFHTTEGELVRSGGASGPVRALHDLLDDTPACPPEADHDRDGLLALDECRNHDAANLMFWAAARDGTRLTPGQAEQARRSALAR